MMAARFRSVTWVGVAVVPALACYLVTQHVAAERAQLAKVERRIGQTRSAIRDLETELGTRGSMAQIERWNGETFALAAPAAEQYVGGNVQLASLTALPALPRPLAPTEPGAVTAQPAIATPASATGAVVQTAARAPAPTLPEVRQAVFHAAAPKPEASPVRQAVLRSTAKDKVEASPVRQAALRTEKAAKASSPVRQAALHAVDRRSEEASPVRQAAFKPARRAVSLPQAEPGPLLHQATWQAPAVARPAPTKVAMLDNGPLDAGTLADIGRIARAERGRPRQ